MSRQEAIQHYSEALREGQRYFRDCMFHGKNPYLHVLDETFEENHSAAHVNLGIIDIPISKIVGSVASGRKKAFAGNFMPLLDEGTEFASKWVSLCEAHLDSAGITDPILCYEYLGYFYVQEGNKRVSVFKSYGAPTISGNVIRVIPKYTEDPQIQLYYEFMEYYKLSKLYIPEFSRSGSYENLLSVLGFPKNHIWTKEERIDFSNAYIRFQEAFDRQNSDHLRITSGDAFLLWLDLYSISDIRNNPEWESTLVSMWPDFRIQSQTDQIALSSAPLAEEDSISLVRRLGFGVINHLNIAFLYAFPAGASAWSAAHEAGQKHVETVLGNSVSVRAYFCNSETVREVMEKAISEGAEVIFATTPPMIDACRQLSAEYPHVKILNCSLSMPYYGVRSYYARVYEAKFITGAIAGAMATDNRIGYIANYPIIGVPASINAFALGAQMSNPRAKIFLKWSCLSGNPAIELQNEGIRVISNKDSSEGNDPHNAWEWGTYQILENGEMKALATPVWNWGSFYEQVIRSIFNGNWDTIKTREADKAVNYWWGISSGVIDIRFDPSLPDGTLQMAQMLRSGLKHEIIDPFHRKIVDQNGIQRNEDVHYYTLDEIMNMDWLCDAVEGSIPRYKDIQPRSRQLVRLLGICRNRIQTFQEEENQ